LRAAKHFREFFVRRIFQEFFNFWKKSGVKISVLIWEFQKFLGIFRFFRNFQDFENFSELVISGGFRISFEIFEFKNKISKVSRISRVFRFLWIFWVGTDGTRFSFYYFYYSFCSIAHFVKIFLIIYIVLCDGIWRYGLLLLPGLAQIDLDIIDRGCLWEELVKK
jgi:hypothetical protein